MDFTKQSPAFLPTCVGMRGLERGLEGAFHKLGWLSPRSVAYVEIEAFAVWNLVKQMEEGLLAPAPIWSDLKTFDWSLVRGKLDFITGGYPCQPFSLAGKQLGVEDPRHLWPYYERGIEISQPVACFFENVRQHLNNGYREVREGLERLGYEVREGIFSAEEVGAPHQRDRLFILAIRSDVADTMHNSGRLSIPERRQDKNIVKVERSREDVVNSKREGLERHPGNDCSEGRTGSAGSIAAAGFPMGQGANQHEWEADRVKPRMGFTINGYNFTEDLLRMAGNGVVEQTAELAFLTLLEKFYST